MTSLFELGSDHVDFFLVVGAGDGDDASMFSLSLCPHLFLCPDLRLVSLEFVGGTLTAQMVSEFLQLVLLVAQAGTEILGCGLLIPSMLLRLQL